MGKRQGQLAAAEAGDGESSQRQAAPTQGIWDPGDRESGTKAVQWGEWWLDVVNTTVLLIEQGGKTLGKTTQ